MMNEFKARQDAGLYHMCVNAYAKINWVLFIRGKRPDGYHELDMLMQTVDLFDTIEIAKSKDLDLTVNGIPSSDPENDLVIRAVRALEAYTGRDLSVRIGLTKRIPSRAGLGGGSSDAASVLNAIRRMYELNISCEQLAAIALSLGADVPFFLTGGLCRIRGIGENIIPLTNPPRIYLVIRHVGEGLSTKEVYRKYDDMNPDLNRMYMETCMDALLRGDYAKLDAVPLNDLEAPAVGIMPEIEMATREMRINGSLYTRMSGSGSAVYGVFPTKEAAQAAVCRMRCGIVCSTLA